MELFEQAAIGIAHIGLDGTFLKVNRKLCEITGYTREELAATRCQDITHPDDHAADLNHFDGLLVSRTGTFTTEKRCIHKNGLITWLHQTVSLVLKPSGEPKYFIALIEDINKRKRAEEELEFKSLLLDSAIDSIIAFGSDERIIYANEAAYETRGYGKEEFIGMFLQDITVPEHADLIKTMIKSAIENGNVKLETGHLRKDGTIMPIEIHAQPVDFRGREVIAAIVRDITERKEVEDLFNYAAHYNPLTGLPNRTLLTDRLNTAIAHTQRNNHCTALLFLDLDNFKTINDTLGHDSGDSLLKKVAERLSKCLREEDTIAHLGGDEFALLLPKVSQIDDAMKVAEKVLEVIRSPFGLGERILHTTTSIGIALCPNDGEDSQLLLKNADTALNRAKELGRNNYQLYTPAMNDRTLERFALENSMRKGLENDEFIVYYQPQVDLHSGEVVGMEALVRWMHPDFGMVPPMEFIPLAEETGFIIQLGEVVLRKACSQNKLWQDEGHGPMKISVNLSAKQFLQRNLVDMVQQVLYETALEPKYLELEITESLLMNDTDAAIEALQKLKDMGVQISIDDFGTGYSSLSRLKKLPIHTLKIDRSFICDIPADSDGSSIAMAIINMAHSLKLKAIAEGVETTEQMNFLRTLKCDEMQGFVFSRPLPAEDATELLKKAKRMCA